jgi:hypothetical protein
MSPCDQISSVHPPVRKIILYTKFAQIHHSFVAIIIIHFIKRFARQEWLDNLNYYFKVYFIEKCIEAVNMN